MTSLVSRASCSPQTARLTCCVVGQPLLPRINLCGAHSAELRRHQVGLGS
jgi:hypothetical protein